MTITVGLLKPLELVLKEAEGPSDIELRALLSETDEVTAKRERAADELKAMAAAQAAFNPSNLMQLQLSTI